jgi:hypothetical protein
MVVRKVLVRQVPIGPALATTRAISSSVAAAIKTRESRKSQLEYELAALEPHDGGASDAQAATATTSSTDDI